ncbi:large subunit ribosomal protein L4 [Candidatus Kinetoplastibacterium oncopeltii TCC290E]|uniref:Large ribosomal subunit protein uL4 n=1 Tax=Candidatus Kinetoplastidibacterium stringomonadis TCC290E TaxID=1208920 RepID=M1M044_9PROT|nr:50S ribosomal protein L4 [Candidatus Kinetoplastibacterium oncopeltii]AGF48704.1 large subunit ribosomal protein L4 [Candidatus Kinetoplastibacterium oncopeltii TCC290E]
MDIKLLDNQDQTSIMNVSDLVFGSEVNESLIHQIVVAFQANARSGNRAQKDRAGVKHSTKKPWRQKGTGRARAGMTSSPLWRGGGRIFPNSPEENFSQKINKKMYRAGIRSILSQLVKEDRILAIDSLKLDSPKTKEAVLRIKNFGSESILIILDEIDENIYLATRNLPHVAIIEPRYIDPLSLIHYKKIVIAKSVVNQLEEMFG